MSNNLIKRPSNLKGKKETIIPHSLIIQSKQTDASDTRQKIR